MPLPWDESTRPLRRALVHLVNNPGDFEPLSRLGFFPGQVGDPA